MDKKAFGFMVRQKRKSLGMTQAQFAKHINKSWITIWRWENAQNPPKGDAIDFWVRKINNL